MFGLKKSLLLALLMLGYSGASHSEYTTADIVESTFSPSCIDYCITGVCFKVVCTPFPVPHCYVKTTPLVNHHLPDLVVSAYNNPAQISWVEARAVIGSGALSGVLDIMASLLDQDEIGGGFKKVEQQRGEGDNIEKKLTNNMKFKEVSIIGNPVIYAVNEVLPGEYFCESDVTPFRPYFQSELDVITWRTSIPELFYPASWVPGQREIGTLAPPQSWGSVHPRTGWLDQEYDSLAGAVFAQRGIDVVTRGGQPHVYSRVPGTEPSNEDTDNWNMISPVTENSCSAFGKDYYYNFGREAPKDDEGYGWLYWTEYECCAGSGYTIGTIYTNPICL